MRLKDKVAVITGAGSGMGRASALLFAKEGAKVVVADINPKSGDETVQLIKQERGEAIFVQVDVSKVGDVENMIKATVESYGKLNILFNHAGMPGPRGLQDVKEDEWDYALDVLTKGGFFACKFAAPEMQKAGGGSIIFTSSTSGIMGSRLSPTYSLGKGGIVTLTKSLALLLARHSIRVNCICPGAVETPMLPDFLGRGMGVDIEKMRGAAVASIPLRRFAQPEEIAWAALFLASDESSYITGIALPVDGGMSAG